MLRRCWTRLQEKIENNKRAGEGQDCKYTMLIYVCRKTNIQSEHYLGKTMKKKLPIKIELRCIEESIRPIAFIMPFAVSFLIIMQALFPLPYYSFPLDAQIVYIFGALIVSSLCSVTIAFLFTIPFRLRFYAEYDELFSIIRMSKEDVEYLAERRKKKKKKRGTKN